jgi:arylsulfatase A-like enzyme
MTAVKPNIVFVLADDVGWNDLSFNNEYSPINTPNIDALAHDGIQLKQHYMHSLCTPSRAALMTGRYHINTGLTYVLAPGTPAGLPDDIPTLPQLLRDNANYKTAMVGKWHLGHAQHKQTPVGKGFETFTGIYMWDTDSWTKQMHQVPWEPAMFIDWVKETETEGDFRHFAEPRHATEAITQEAEDILLQHATQHPDQPLFLYVAYTAAHSPLQPLPRHEPPCAHISHLWRRQFCGMVLGVDEGVGNLTRTIRDTIGENTILVVTSDNGGSPWFGGNNTPLRSGKHTPYEGGVRVPGLIYDFTREKTYLGNASYDGDRQAFHGLMHVSDWLPTLTAFAGIESTKLPAGLDGLDFSSAFRELSTSMSLNSDQEVVTYSPRSEMLLELYSNAQFVFHEELSAYRIGDYKLIEGIVRDENYYYEAVGADRLNISSPSLMTLATETVNRAFDSVFGNSNNDLCRIVFTHQLLQGSLAGPQRAGKVPTVRLYHIPSDPTESSNLSEQPEYAKIISDIRARVQFYQSTRRPPLDAHLIVPLDKWQKEMQVPGDCSMHPQLRNRPAECHFTHPWIPDNVTDIYNFTPLVHATTYSSKKIREGLFGLHVIVPLFGVLLLISRIIARFFPSSKKSSKKRD